MFIQNEDDIHTHQGSSAESYVSALLGRRGFSVNSSENDYWGWDLSAEHRNPAISSMSSFIPQLECRIQVKSTRVDQNNVVKVKLSALNHLAKSSSTCVIAFVKFTPGEDHPDTISFIHVGRKVIDLTLKAIDAAAAEGVSLHKRWTTIPTDDALHVSFLNSKSSDIYAAFVGFRKEFKEVYAAEKSKYYKQACGLPEATETQQFYEVQSDSTLVNFTYKQRVATLHATKFFVYNGPISDIEYRNPYFTIKKHHKKIIWFLHNEGKLSELATAIEAMDIALNDGWGVQIESDGVCSAAYNRASEARTEDMVQVGDLAKLFWLACREKGLDPIVDFEAIGGELFDDPDFNDLVRVGGYIKTQASRSRSKRRRLTKGYRIAGLIFSVTWSFEVKGVHGDLAEVGRGRVVDLQVFFDEDEHHRYHQGFWGATLMDFKDSILLFSSSRTKQPAVADRKRCRG